MKLLLLFFLSGSINVTDKEVVAMGESTRECYFGRFFGRWELTSIIVLYFRTTVDKCTLLK